MNMGKLLCVRASEDEEKEEKLVTRSGGEWICLKPHPLLDDFVAEVNRIRDRESQQEGRRVVEKERRARDRLAMSQFFGRRGVSWPGRKKIEQES